MSPEKILRKDGINDFILTYYVLTPKSLSNIVIDCLKSLPRITVPSSLSVLNPNSFLDKLEKRLFGEDLCFQTLLVHR